MWIHKEGRNEAARAVSSLDPINRSVLIPLHASFRCENELNARNVNAFREKGRWSPKISLKCVLYTKVYRLRTSSTLSN